MKNRIHKILGIGLALILALALVAGFALPVAADPGVHKENKWEQFEYPVPGLLGDWFRSADIAGIGPMAEAINGDVYAYVGMGPECELEGDGTAIWTTAQAYSGSDSVFLSVPSASEYAELYFPVSINLEDIDLDTTSFWCYSTVGATIPYFIFEIPGDFTGTADLLRINNDAAASGPFIGNWAEFTAADNIGPWQWEMIDTSTWTITDSGWDTWADLVTLHGDETVDCVLVENSGVGAVSAYIDYVTINGVSYDLEDGRALRSRLFKSTDGGRTWAESIAAAKYAGGPIVDMVCSSIDEDILYVTDGNYLYKSADGSDTFAPVAKDSLEEALMGECGITVTDFPITCIDVGYADDDPFVFIGTRDVGHVYDVTPIVGSVHWISEAGYPATWTDLELHCYGAGYDAYSVGCALDFDDSLKTFVVVSDGSETHVVSTIGVHCSWVEVAELLQNCVPANNFGIREASRIGFPDDYEDTETLFVGVTGVDLEFGGDVYMATVTVPQSDAIDLNLGGIVTGCIGKVDATNVISLDIFGDTDEASLIAGTFGYVNPIIFNEGTDVYYSIDGGWSWDVSAKDPTGGDPVGAFFENGRVEVLWYEDSALAATRGAECAVSLSCGEEAGEYWNQISLIATSIDEVLSADHSPGYVVDSETMFMLTNYDTTTDTQSLFRYDQTYWERVHCSTISGADESPAFRSVLVSPDFLDTDALYLANTDFEMWRSLDAGCSWTKLTFPCKTRPTISAWVVIDEDTVIAGGDGVAWKTERHGARPWGKFLLPAVAGWVQSFDLEPGYDDPGTVILGDKKSQVFISEDGGEEWEMVGTGAVAGCKAILTGSNQTWVAFDPDYATNDTFYAAAGAVIARSTIDPDEDMADQGWVKIGGQAGDIYWGIETAGDTALYVTNKACVEAEVREVTISGTIEVKCAVETWSADLDIDEVVTEISGYFINGELVTIIAWDLVCEGDYVVGEIGLEGVNSGATGMITLTADDGLYCGCGTDVPIVVISCFLRATVTGVDITAVSGVMRSLNPLDDVEPKMKVRFERLTKGLPVATTVSPPAYPSCLHGLRLTTGSNWLWTLDYTNPKVVWTYEDTLAEPVILKIPIDGRKLAAGDEVTLSWEELDDATWYEVSLYRYCAECPDLKDKVTVAKTKETCITVTGLKAGTLYYWQVRVAFGSPTLSKWSEERTFTTAISAVPYLCSPVCGGQDIILTPNFSWDAVKGATGYDIELATTETFTAGVVRGSATVNAWVTQPLDYATTYYWRVRSEKDGVYSDWSVCIFTTMEEPAPPPPPPVIVEPTPPAPVVPAPIIEFPPTPSWVWAIIGIGTALVVVVIVLTVRTRRPPA